MMEIDFEWKQIPSKILCIYKSITVQLKTNGNISAYYNVEEDFMELLEALQIFFLGSHPSSFV
jgi:hypothetical protein